MIEFNVNETVLVRLNDRGRKLHRERYEEMMSHYPKAEFSYRPPEEDADGWSSWQLWCLMQDFGPYISLGSSTPFETFIRIDEAKGRAVLPTPPAAAKED